MVTSGFFDYENMPKVAYSPDLVRALEDLFAAIFLSQLLFYIRVYEKRWREIPGLDDTRSCAEDGPTGD